MSLNLNATGARTPLPFDTPGIPGREAHERAAAEERAQQRAGEPDAALCAPKVPGLQADLLFSLLAENVRDYADGAAQR